MTTDLFTYLFKLLSDYLRAEFQTGYIVVNCRALTFTVVTVHCNMLNAYDDEWVHLRIYLFMRRWITFGWLRNYGAKVTMSVYDAHGWGGGYCGLWHIYDRGFSHVWQFVTEGREGVKFGGKKCDIFFEWAHTTLKPEAHTLYIQISVLTLDNHHSLSHTSHQLNSHSDTLHTLMYVRNYRLNRTLCNLCWWINHWKNKLSQKQLKLQLNFCNQFWNTMCYGIF